MGPYEASLRQAARERRQRLDFPEARQCENLSRSPALASPSASPFPSSTPPALSSPLSCSTTSVTKPRLTIHAVQARVAAAFGISQKNKRIWLQRRSERMYSPRNIAMALARELMPDASFTKITHAFGEKCHSMVSRACKSVEMRADDGRRVQFDAMVVAARVDG